MGTLGYKIPQKVKEELARDNENASKPHILVTYTFEGKKGTRVLRLEKKDAFLGDLYYDYQTGKTGTLDWHTRYNAIGNVKTQDVDVSNGKNAQIPGEEGKGSILVTYKFEGKDGKRMMRLAGKDENGNDLYYDSFTDRTMTLERHADYNRISNVKTQKIAANEGVKALPAKGVELPKNVNLQPRKPEEIKGKPDMGEKDRIKPELEEKQPVAPPQREIKNFVVEYTFGGRKGSRVMRLEDNSGKGKDLYYDYQTGKTGTLDWHAKYIGAEKNSMKAGKETVGKPVVYAPKDDKKKEEKPKNMAPPRKEEYYEYMDGRYFPKSYGVKTKERFSGNAILDSAALFAYFQREQKGGAVVHCAGFASWKLSTYLGSNGMANPLKAVSSWNLKEYLESKHNRNYFEQVNLNPEGKKGKELTKDIISVMADKENKIPAGSIVTVWSGHEYSDQGWKKGQPTHTMVYVGDGKWTHNVDDLSPAVTNFRKDKDAKQFFNEFNFSWAEESRLYKIKIENFPPGIERKLALQDVGITGQANVLSFASELSKAYNVSLEYAYNEIMRQNPALKASKAYGDISVQLVISSIYVDRLVSKAPNWNSKPPVYGTKTKKEIAAIDERTDDFSERCKDIDSFYVFLGIAPRNVDALKMVLYNEYYQSQEKIDKRKIAKTLLVDTLGVNSDINTPIGNTKIDSWGEFQNNIDFVVRFLSDKKKREDFIMTFKVFKNLDVASPLSNWGNLDEKGRRTAAAGILGEFRASLFFANKLYTENLAVLSSNAVEKFNSNAVTEDLELTAIFNYDRNSQKTNIAIFQQNLLIEAENIIGRDPKSGNAASLKALLGRYKVDGSLGDPAKTTSVSYELFRIVCEANRIDRINANFKAYDAESVTYSQFLDVFGANFIYRDKGGKEKRISNYEKMADFFKMPQFRQNYIEPRTPTYGQENRIYSSALMPITSKTLDALGVGTPKPNAANVSSLNLQQNAVADRLPGYKRENTKPLLSYVYLNQHKQHLTPYLANYFKRFEKAPAYYAYANIGKK